MGRWPKLAGDENNVELNALIYEPLDICAPFFIGLLVFDWTGDGIDFYGKSVMVLLLFSIFHAGSSLFWFSLLFMGLTLTETSMFSIYSIL